MSSDQELDREVRRAKQRADKALERVYSLSVVLLRSQCLLEVFMAEMVTVAQLSDQQITQQILEDVTVLRNSPPSRVISLSLLHLATLYVVIEKWREWKFADPEVDRLLENPWVDRLKQFRHAIFHGDKFDSSRLLAITLEPEMITWTNEVVGAFRAALIDWHENQDKRMEEYLRSLGW